MSRGATPVSSAFRNSSVASSAAKPRTRPPKFSDLRRFSTTLPPVSARRNRTMWLRPQIVSAERTATAFPHASASSDSATLVSAADSTGDSAGESVTKKNAITQRGELEKHYPERRRASEPAGPAQCFTGIGYSDSFQAETSSR